MQQGWEHGRDDSYKGDRDERNIYTVLGSANVLSPFITQLERKLESPTLESDGDSLWIVGLGMGA